MQVLKEIKMEDFQAKTTPHFDTILRVALRLTKNQTEAQALTTEVYLKAWTAFCFYKPEIDCCAWLLKILSRQFNRCHRKITGSELVEDGSKRLKLSESVELK